MTIENPSSLDENAIKLAGQEDDCDLAAGAGTEKNLVPACPTGIIFIPIMVILDEFSAEDHATVPIVTFGIAGGDCDEFLGNQTLTVSAAYATEVLIMQPIPAATTAVSVKLTAGQVFAMEITQANGAALTARVSVLGLYKKA